MPPPSILIFLSLSLFKLADSRILQAQHLHHIFEFQEMKFIRKVIENLSHQWDVFEPMRSSRTDFTRDSLSHRVAFCMLQALDSLRIHANTLRSTPVVPILFRAFPLRGSWQRPIPTVVSGYRRRKALSDKNNKIFMVSSSHASLRSFPRRGSSLWLGTVGRP